jgi:hypothetical protein
MSSKLQNSYLEVNHAGEHLLNVNQILKETPPFFFVSTTNIETRKRSFRTEKDESISDNIRIHTRGVVNSLRVALDYAYWDIVRPSVSAREERSLSFPITRYADGLDAVINERYAGKVSHRFVRTIRQLRPYHEPNGNVLLYLIHYLDSISKHRFPPPTANYGNVSGEFLNSPGKIPDFPLRFPRNGPSVRFGPGFGDRTGFAWDLSDKITQDDMGAEVPGFPHIFEKKIYVPVDIHLVVNERSYENPLVETLNDMVDTTKETLVALERFV